MKVLLASLLLPQMAAALVLANGLGVRPALAARALAVAPALRSGTAIFCVEGDPNDPEEDDNRRIDEEGRETRPTFRFTPFLFLAFLLGFIGPPISTQLSDDIMAPTTRQQLRQELREERSLASERTEQELYGTFPQLGGF